MPLLKAEDIEENVCVECGRVFYYQKHNGRCGGCNTRYHRRKRWEGLPKLDEVEYNKTLKKLDELREAKNGA
jgi:hypothetical protein